MYIDFHCHAYADKIAERAVSTLAQTANLSPCTDGTITDTIVKLKEWGIDYGVMLPVATKPTQQDIVNSWAAQVNGGSIISFGSVFPLAEDALSQLDTIASYGLKGIKLHPDYQGFMLDDERILPLLKRCEELGLIVIFHMGFDDVSPDLIHATPKSARSIIERIPKLKLVLAHLGGNKLWDDVERYLVGTNCYLDTSFLVGLIEPSQLERIIKHHGADRILLASDCPWNKTTDVISLIESISLTEREKSLIYYENAASLLNL